MFCTHCGKELADNSRFCPNCGAKIEESTEEVKTEPDMQEYDAQYVEIPTPVSEEPAQQSASLSAPYAPVDAEKKKKKKFLVVGIIVAVLMFYAAIAFAFFGVLRNFGEDETKDYADAPGTSGTYADELEMGGDYTDAPGTNENYADALGIDGDYVILFDSALEEGYIRLSFNCDGPGTIYSFISC